MIKDGGKILMGLMQKLAKLYKSLVPPPLSYASQKF